MFDWKVKEIKATNAIFLGDKTEGEGRPFKARFLQAGLVKYDFGVCLLKKETIDRFVNTFIDCPVVINHKDDIKKEDKQGTIKSIWFAPEDGWFWCSGVLDEEAAEKVEKGFNVSCQYRITEYSNNTENKLHNGNPYDKEILNGVFEHLAIVKTPRYEDAYIAVNAIEWDEEDMKASNKEMKADNGFITIDGGTEDERVIWVPFEVLSEKARKHITEIADNYKEGDETKFDFSHTRVKPTEEQINYLKDTLKEIQNKYKFKGVAQIEISSELNKGSLGVCCSPDNCSVVALSPQLYNGKHDQERWNKSVESGFHPKGTGEMIKSVLVHELGHAITCNSKNDKFWSEIEGIRKEYMKEIKRKDIENPDFISGYARTNKYEFVAEAFSQGMLAKTYGKYTKKVMEVMDKHFKSGNQTQSDVAKNETKEDNKEMWLEEYGLGYPIDEEAFEEFNKEQDKETKQTASNSFLDSFKDFVYNRLTEELNDRLGELTASNEEHWITIHPHGEDSEDYRRLKIEDGETPKEAIDRVYKKDDKKKEEKPKEKLVEKYTKIIDNKKDEEQKENELFQSLNVKLNKHKQNIIGLIDDFSDHKKVNEIFEKYSKEHPEVKELDEKTKQSYERLGKLAKEREQINKDFANEILNTDIETLSKEGLQELKEALVFSHSIYTGFETREKLTAFERKVLGKIDSLKYSENRKEVKEIAGVKKGKPMTFDEADNGKVNPNYLNNKPGISFGQNCQSCVVCFEMRQRGFNVQTKGIPVDKKGRVIQKGEMYEIAVYPTRAWIDPKTGKEPEKNICTGTTPEKAYKWLNENIKDGNYSFRMVWKDSTSGHIVNAFRRNGELIVYDPQTNKEYGNKEAIINKYFAECKLRPKNEYSKPYLFRVDNLDLNPEYADALMEKA